MAVGEGAFLRQGGATTSFSSQVDTAGQIVVNASRSGSGGAQAEQVLLSLTLKLQSRPADGQAQVRLLSLAPLGLGGTALNAAQTQPLQVTVTP
jgi:general secretion pathway protein D